MSLETVIAALGLVTAVGAAALAWTPQRQARWQRQVELFVRVRRHLGAHRADLVTACLLAQSAHRADQELALLTRPGWIPQAPLPLDAVSLRLRSPAPNESADEALGAARRWLRRYWPRVSWRHRQEGYSASIGAYDRPAMWFDGPSYRLLEVAPAQPGPVGRGPEFSFSLSSYFAGLDTTEPLGYEAALRHLRGTSQPVRGPYRRWLGDPFDLGARAALPGVSTLTVRKDSDEASFFLHHRAAGQVALASGTTHVAPAGEFQPHANVLPVLKSDLDLWRTTMREYAEEFLGAADALGEGGVTIDYARDAPYAEFQRAARDGQVRVRFLGLGLDPLSWKPELCLVCVWDAAVFDDIFATMRDHNEEGVLIVGARAGQNYQGLPFTSDVVRGYANSSATLPAGRACLTLAWRWRDALGLSQPPSS